MTCHEPFHRRERRVPIVEIDRHSLDRGRARGLKLRAEARETIGVPRQEGEPDPKLRDRARRTAPDAFTRAADERVTVASEHEPHQSGSTVRV